MCNLPDFYDSNLSLLRRHHKEAFATITKTANIRYNCEISLAANGKPSLKLKDKLIDGQAFFLHNTSDPQIEVAQFLDMVSEDSYGVVVLLGMGLGYTPLTLLKERKNIRHFFIFEMNVGIFEQALHVMDLAPLLSDERVVLRIGSDDDVPKTLELAGRALQLEPIHLLRHIPSFRMTKDYEELNRKVFSIMSSYNMEGQTMSQYGEKFLSNRLRFLNSVHHNSFLENLKGKFSNIPALLVAGGPSLDKNIEYLKKIENQALILCVDSVLPLLLKQGIKPHFVTSIDYKEITYEKIAEAAPIAKDLNFICMSWVTEKIPKIFPTRHIFWTFSMKSVERWINNILGGSLFTFGATTVAHLNLTAALAMGCSPIIFVGQDLAYSNAKAYAGDVAISNQDQVENIINSKEAVQWVKGNNGEQLPTSRQMLNMKEAFEAVIKNTPNQYINATEGGCYIEGTEVTTLKEVIAEYCHQPYNLLERIDTSTRDKSLPDGSRLYLELKMMVNLIKDQQNIVKKSDKLAAYITKKISKLNPSQYTSFDVLPEGLQKKIVKIDECHKKLDNANLLWQVLEEVTLGGLKVSERMRQEIQTLTTQPELYLQWLLKNIERLDEINTVRTNVLSAFGQHLSKALTHLDKEKKIMSELDQNQRNPVLLMNLIRLYFNSGDLARADSILDQFPLHETAAANRAEALFYKGVIAAHHVEYAKSEALFQEAVQTDATISTRIQAFRDQWGSEYWEFAQQFEKLDQSTYKRMLFKGLKYCATHEKIKHGLTARCQKDLVQVKALFESMQFEAAQQLLTPWIEELGKNKNLAVILEPEQISDCFQYRGNLLIKNGEYEKAIHIFKTALDYFPDNPKFHIFLTDAFFAADNFTEGITYLNKAVQIDRNYAVYWENMGNNLLSAHRYNDAIIAFEQCINALPEKVYLLKRIADCYTGQSSLEETASPKASTIAEANDSTLREYPSQF